MKRAMYAFSGDPITLGHLDIIKRAAEIFDELIVAIGINPAKKYLFTLEERASLVEEALVTIKNVKVVSFRGLLVDYAYENNIPIIIRGLRNSEDFNFELMLHQIGESQKMQIETLFIPSRQELSHISSGAAKALQIEQGLIHEYVPLNVKQKLEEKLSQHYIIGITGEIGVGKSYISEKIKQFGEASGIAVHRIDMDILAHELLSKLTEPLFVKLRQEIIEKFGVEVKAENGFINVKVLGKIIFSDVATLNSFNNLIYKPLLLRLRRELYGKKGLILLESALISESKMGYICNNNIILVSTTKNIQHERLKKRNYTDEQLQRKLLSQFNYDLKLRFFEDEIAKSKHGKIFKLENEDVGMENIKSVFENIVSTFEIPLNK